MSERREIRSFDYVNHAYANVRDVLAADPAGVFQAATRAAASRAQSVAAELHVKVAGPADASLVTRIPVQWEAARRPDLFPLMNAELSIYQLTATETQLDFLGRYEPPFGVFGGAVNAVIGHRIAEATVHRFVADVAGYLRERLR